MVLTDSSESATNSRMISSICFAEALDCSASFPISSATTAKPLPASPALAASMEAFRDSRLVWLAMSAISLVTSRIWDADSLVFWVCSAIALTASMVSELMRSRSVRISCAVFWASIIDWEASDRACTLPLVCSINCPISVIFSEVSLVLSACELAPDAISDTAWSTCPEVSDIFSAFFIMASDEENNFSDWPWMFAMVADRRSCRNIMERAIRPNSSFLLPSFSTISSLRRSSSPIRRM